MPSLTSWSSSGIRRKRASFSFLCKKNSSNKACGGGAVATLFPFSFSRDTSPVRRSAVRSIPYAQRERQRPPFLLRHGSGADPPSGPFPTLSERDNPHRFFSEVDISTPPLNLSPNGEKETISRVSRAGNPKSGRLAHGSSALARRPARRKNPMRTGTAARGRERAMGSTDGGTSP